jgi:hypothetical protein
MNLTFEQLQTALAKATAAGATQDASMIRQLMEAMQPASSIPTGGITAPAANWSPPEETSLGQKAVGAIETAAALGTGATTGALGTAIGGFRGLAGAILSGQFGTPEAMQHVMQMAQQGGAAGTYLPRTAAGQQMAQGAGQMLEPLQALGMGNPNIIRAARQRPQAPAQGVAQAPLQGVAPGAARGAQAAEQAAAGMKAADVVPPVAMEPEAIAALIQKADGYGPGSTKAKQKLAEFAKINPLDKASAEALGFELPIDVFSDSHQARATMGMERSQKTSVAAAEWAGTIEKAKQNAQQIMEGLDARYVEGTPAVGNVSADVKQAAIKSRDELKASAKQLYEKVDNAVSKTEAVDAPATLMLIGKTLAEVQEGGLNGLERNLKKAIDDGMTYGRLVRERQAIGEAINRNESFYGGATLGTLKKLYGALSDDQMAAVKQLGSDELGLALKEANNLTKRQKGMEARIVNAFGENVDGSIASIMDRAIKEGKGGGNKEFNRLMKTIALVPPDLQRETVATALAAATTSRTGKGIGFTDFNKVYQGLRANTPVYSKIVQILGPDSDRIMRDMNVVSKRLANDNLTYTGAANQKILQAMQAENMMMRMLRTTAGKAAAVGAGAVGGGPIGAGAAHVIAETLLKPKGDASVKAATAMFASPEFADMALNKKLPVERFVKTPSFLKWAATVQLPKNEHVNYMRGLINSASEQNDD